MATSPRTGPTSICTAFLRATAPSEQQCFPNQHHGERSPPSLRALHMEDYEKLPFGRAPRSSCARFAQRLREGPSRSRSLQFQLFVGLLLSHGFLTKSSPETCTFLAARRMMSPREATLFRRGSQIERHDVFFITVWPAVPDGPPNRAGTYYRRSRNLPPRPLLKDLPTTN